MDFYTVLEIQSDNGTKTCIPTIYEDKTLAYAAYFTLCATAIQSAIEYHAASIIRSDNQMIEGRVFDRRTAEQEETNNEE